MKTLLNAAMAMIQQMLTLRIGVKLKIEASSGTEKGYDEEGGLDPDVDEFLQFENSKDEEETPPHQDILMYMSII